MADAAPAKSLRSREVPILDQRAGTIEGTSGTKKRSHSAGTKEKGSTNEALKQIGLHVGGLDSPKSGSRTSVSFHDVIGTGRPGSGRRNSTASTLLPSGLDVPPPPPLPPVRATATALDATSEHSVTLQDIKHELATDSEVEPSDNESYGGDNFASDEDSEGDQHAVSGQTGQYNLFALDQANLSPIPHSLQQYDLETEVTSPSRSFMIDSVTSGNKAPVVIMHRSMTGNDGNTSSLGLTGLATQYGLASQHGPSRSTTDLLGQLQQQAGEKEARLRLTEQQLADTQLRLLKVGEDLG